VVFRDKPIFCRSHSFPNQNISFFLAVHYPPNIFLSLLVLPRLTIWFWWDYGSLNIIKLCKQSSFCTIELHCYTHIWPSIFFKKAFIFTLVTASSRWKCDHVPKWLPCDVIRGFRTKPNETISNDRNTPLSFRIETLLSFTKSFNSCSCCSISVTNWFRLACSFRFQGFDINFIHENFRSIWDTKIGQIIVIAFHDDGKCIANCYYCDKPYPNQSVVHTMPLISPRSFLVEIVVPKGSMVHEWAAIDRIVTSNMESIHQRWWLGCVLLP